MFIGLTPYVVMDILISPLTVQHLVIVVLDVVIAGYLVSRPQKSRADWLLVALFGLMAGGRLCYVFASTQTGDAVYALRALTNPFLLGAFAVHLHFAYAFLGNPFPRESRVVLPFSYGLAAVLSAHPTWSGITGLVTGTTPPPFGSGLTHSVFLISNALTLMFVWSLVVYLRKTVHSTRAASVETVSWWRAIAHPVGRMARAHRAFLLPWALLFPLLVQSSVLVHFVPRSEGGIVALVLELARACAFVLVYLAFAPKPTSLRAKLSGTALVATLVVFSTLVAVLFPLDAVPVEDLGSLQRNMERHEQMLPVVWLLFLATAAVLIGFPLLLRSSLTAPIDRLLAGIRRVDAGERDLRVAVATEDEIGRVAHHFNEMTASLAASEAELRAHAEHLEERVAARTAELEAEKAKTEAQAERLAELDEAKSRFFANVSHELRTPLTLLLGPLRDARAGPEQRISSRHLPAMHRSAERLLSLVDELLDLARLDAGRLRLRVAETDLVALARRTTSAFASRAEHEGLALNFEAQPERLDAWVDAERVEQILSNLLTNAFKFTPEGGRIEVTIQKGDGTAVLSVRDTGSGISADMLPHVFERFRQAYDASTRHHVGAGIGLALARELVTLHAGSISVESTTGVGSMFTVLLPLGKDHFDADAFADAPSFETGHFPAHIEHEANGLESERELAAPAPPSDATVLVVEDHPDMRDYLCDLLAPHYHVEQAEDGQAGLETARRLAAEGRAPDLVISDVMMPRLDGVALCHTLKADPSLGHVPVVLLTARADEESRIEGLGEGADDYLAKPFSAVELLARCENLIEVRRRLRARFSGEVVVQPTDVVVPSEEAAWLEEVKAACEARLADAEFGVDWLADVLGMARRTLERRLKAASGLTPGAFLRTMRLERAAQLLEQKAGNVAAIARAVGYTDAESFGRAFRQGFGVPPSAYAEGTRQEA